MRVCVIGAGVIGAAIATELARRGAEVVLLDSGWAGGGTSSTSFAWANANGKEPESYYLINARGLEAHHRAAVDGATWFRGTGHLEIAVDPVHEKHLRRRVEALERRGYATEWLEADDARRISPDLIVPDHAAAIAFFPHEGHVFPALYLAQVLGTARGLGVDVHESTRVVGFEEAGEGVEVVTDAGERFAADRVVLAAGRWSGEVARLAGASVPLTTFSEPGDITVGYLWQTNPVTARLDTLVTTPWLNLRPEGGGRILLQALDLDATAAPEVPLDPQGDIAAEMLSRLRAVLHGTSGARIVSGTVGQRVMPRDGRTICGPTVEAPWLYSVATHSGVTLAPFLGPAVAAELFGEVEPLLEDFRPKRFVSGDRYQTPITPRKPGEQ